jgi:DNA-binding CsgD family transcriptional regulator
MARPAALTTSASFQLIDKCRSIEDLAALCADSGSQAGYKWFCIFYSGNRPTKKFSDRLLLSNWPSQFIDWLDAIFDTEEATAENQLLRDSLPMKWTVSEEDGAIGAGFADFGLKRNLMLKVQTPISSPAIFMFSGDRHSVTSLELMTLNFSAQLLFDKFCVLQLASEHGKLASLSPRERECLRWTALGKTSAEIGIILDLSEHTINNYLNNACRKIDATNRSHAVYMATRKGIIF